MSSHSTYPCTISYLSNELSVFVFVFVFVFVLRRNLCLVSFLHVRHIYQTWSAMLNRHPCSALHLFQHVDRPLTMSQRIFSTRIVLRTGSLSPCLLCPCSSSDSLIGDFWAVMPQAITSMHQCTCKCTRTTLPSAKLPGHPLPLPLPRSNSVTGA